MVARPLHPSNPQAILRWGNLKKLGLEGMLANYFPCISGKDNFPQT